MFCAVYGQLVFTVLFDLIVNWVCFASFVSFWIYTINLVCVILMWFVSVSFCLSWKLDCNALFSFFMVTRACFTSFWYVMFPFWYLIMYLVIFLPEYLMLVFTIKLFSLHCTILICNVSVWVWL